MQTEGRTLWASRPAFILAAIGSAIGLGNLIRFPYICAKNGGGAFVIAYIIAMITVGIPIMMLEFGLGHSSQGAAPKAMRKIHPRLEWLGWAASGVGFVIVTYYAVIMAWAFEYLLNFRTIGEWGPNAKDYFYSSTLGLTSSALEMGSFRWPLLLGLSIIWVAIIASVWKGARTVSKVVYATVLIPWLILLIFVGRAVTLPGAGAGLAYYLTPVWSKLLNPEVWLAAYTQTFFSLSVGFGIMIAYSSFLPRKANLTKNAIIICVADGVTALVAGLAVFGSAGWLAQNQGVSVEQILSQMKGLGLAFITYPTIISQLPYPMFFCFLFFLMILTLGIDSAFSLLESVTAAIRDKWGLKHWQSNLIVGGICFLGGLPLITGCGLYWIDTIDYFMCFYGLALVCLIECLIVAFAFKTGRMREYLNKLSTVKLGKWWDIMIMAVAPVGLVFLLVMETIARVKGSYEGYPRVVEFLGGWTILILIPVAGFILSKLPWRVKE